MICLCLIWVPLKDEHTIQKQYTNTITGNNNKIRFYTLKDNIYTFFLMIPTDEMT